MLKIFRMEWFRMYKSPSTYLILIAFVGMYGFASFIVGLLCGDSGMARDFQRLLEMDGEIFVADYGEMLTMTFQGNTTLLFVSIWTGLFVTAHRATGFRKTLCGCAGSPELSVSAGLLSMIYSTVLVLIALPELRAVMLLTHRTVLPPSAGILQYLLIYILLNAAYAAFCTLLAGCFKSRIPAVAVPLVYCTAGANLLYYVMDKLIMPAFGAENFLLEYFLPTGNIRTLTISDSPARFWTAAASAVVFWMFMTFLGAWRDSRQEIR